jgi:hypothetical protein
MAAAAMHTAPPPGPVGGSGTVAEAESTLPVWTREAQGGHSVFFSRRLVEAMQGWSDQEKLDMAWGLYARRKLTEQRFGSIWERAYLELDEFEMVLASMAVCHFGAQYPCFSRQEPIPSDWWHLRLHLYVGNKLVLPNQVVLVDAEEKELKNHNVVEEPVASSTINLLKSPPHLRGLLAALPLLMPGQ